MNVPAWHNTGAMSWIFGYGSLVHLPRLARFLERPALPPRDVVFCRLEGFRRTWGVAMDNRLDIPGYKHYREPMGGTRPAVYVTFLDLRRRAGSAVNGVAFRVEDHELERIRRREGNYELSEVTDSLSRPLDGPVLTSLGLPAARDRYRTGRAQGRAVVRLSYHQTVLDGFRRLGPNALAEYRASTDPPEVPLIPLERCPVNPGNP